MEKLVSIERFICYGYPTKTVVNDMIRKRGYLRKDEEKVAITNNTLIEQLLGPEAVENHLGCICLEDVIDNIIQCKKSSNHKMFELI